MLHRYQVMALAAFLTISFTACLNDDDEKYADYDDTAVTAFVLQQMNAFVHTTNSQGEDSVFKAYVDGTKVPIYIDQLNNKIYNVDSLPASTDIEHVLVALSTKNNCYAMWRSLTEDRLLYHSSEDSLDFSVPRELYVFTTSGKYYRKYDVVISKHKQEGDLFHWRGLGANPTFAALKGMRAAANEQTLFVAGTDGSNTTLYSSPANDGKTWQPIVTGLPQQAWQTLVVHQGKPHLADGGGNLYVVESNDNYASATMQTYSTGNVYRLLASDVAHLYGMNADGDLMRTATADSYQNWTTETLDDDRSLLPTQHISATHIALRTTDNSGRLVIVGNYNDGAFASDSTASIWSRLTGSADLSADNTWMRYTGQHATYSLPRMFNLCTVAYGEDILALGGQPIAPAKTPALKGFFRSIDGGISWKQDTRISLPQKMNSSKTVFALTVDANNYIWLFCGESGEIWRGRLNRMAWTEHQKEFR